MKRNIQHARNAGTRLSFDGFHRSMGGLVPRGLLSHGCCIFRERREAARREIEDEAGGRWSPEGERPPVLRIGRWIRLSSAGWGGEGEGKWTTAPNLYVPLPGDWTSRSQNKRLVRIREFHSHVSPRRRRWRVANLTSKISGEKRLFFLFFSPPAHFSLSRFVGIFFDDTYLQTWDPRGNPEGWGGGEDRGTRSSFFFSSFFRKIPPELRSQLRVSIRLNFWWKSAWNRHFAEKFHENKLFSILQRSMKILLHKARFHAIYGKIWKIRK